MIFIKSFLVGGIICAIVQIFIDKTKLTPGRIMVGLVSLGVILQRPLFAESIFLQHDAGQSAAARHHFFTKLRRCGRPSG